MKKDIDGICMKLDNYCSTCFQRIKKHSIAPRLRDTVKLLKQHNITDESPLIEKWRLLFPILYKKNNRDALIMAFSLLCYKQRFSQILLIKMEDIDFEKKTVCFLKGGKADSHLFYIFSIPDCLYTLLDTYIKEKNITSGLLFTTSSGKSIFRSRMNYCFNYIKELIPELESINPDHIRRMGKQFYQEGYAWDYIFEI